MSKITEKAMLVKLSISIWGNRRQDRRADDVVAEKFGLAKGTGRYWKYLVDPKALRPVHAAATALRLYFYEQTLPWADEGLRILPATLYLDFTRKMRELRDAFYRAVGVFVGQYPGLVKQAERDLNGLFILQQYPPVTQIREKFGIKIEVRPIPSGNDFRVQLQQEEVDRIRQEVDHSVRDAITGTVRDVFLRLKDALEHMVDRLSDEEKIFRNSLIPNLRRIVGLIPHFNLTDDPRLTDLYRQMLLLIQHDSETLREDSRKRHIVADHGQRVLSVLESYLKGEDVP